MANTWKQLLWFVDSTLIDDALRYLAWCKVRGDVDDDALETGFLRRVVTLAETAGMTATSDHIASHYERADDDFIRPLGCAGDPNGVGSYGARLVAAHMDERVIEERPANDATDGPVNGESIGVSWAAFASALASHDASGRSRFAETAEAAGHCEWNDAKQQPNMVQLSQVLGVARATAQERWKAFRAFVDSETFRQSLGA